MFGLVIVIALSGTVVWLTYRNHPVCGAFIGLGVLGFFGAALLPAAGIWLQHVELPPFFETTSIVGSEGKTFTATIPLARIQRYDSNGRFETGWFVNSAGGIFAIGLTRTGQVAVAAARTKQVEFFNPDGSSAGPPRPFIWSGGFTGGRMEGVLQPSDCWVEGVTFVNPIRAEGPKAHWGTLVMFPLWHPFVSWLLFAAGTLAIRLQKPSTNTQIVPLP
jgi:hypothetical protein